MKVSVDLELTKHQVEFVQQYPFHGTDANYEGRFLDRQYSFYWDNYKEYYHDVRLQLIELGLIDAVQIDVTYTKYRLTKIGEMIWEKIRSHKS